MNRDGISKMAQPVRTYATKTDNLSSIPELTVGKEKTESSTCPQTTFSLWHARPLPTKI